MKVLVLLLVFAVPASAQQVAPAPITPAPLTLNGVDLAQLVVQLSSLRAELADVKQAQAADTAALRGDLKSMQDAQANLWRDAAMFTVKYIVPAVGGLVTGIMVKK